jgi:hypothetical protein
MHVGKRKVMLKGSGRKLLAEYFSFFGRRHWQCIIDRCGIVVLRTKSVM